MGELLVRILDTLEEQIFEWSVFLNEETFEIESNRVIDLVPGIYLFSLLLTKGPLQYASSTSQIIVDGSNNVAFTVRPVIGDTVITGT